VTGWQRLRADQVAQFNRLGFVQPFDIFGPQEIGRIRAISTGSWPIWARRGITGSTATRRAWPGIWDIATDPRILDHVQDVVGPDIICWASAILSKKPEGSRAGAVAPGCQFLEAEPGAHRDRLARHRRRG
jgi:non-heme Fe2+,alpha-ketoglutarate-dependent halogenase